MAEAGFPSLTWKGAAPGLGTPDDLQARGSWGRMGPSFGGASGMAHRDGRRGFGSRVWLGIAALLLVACAAAYAEDMLVPVYVDGTLR